MSKSALPIVIAILAAAGGCGTQLTDGRYAGEPVAVTDTTPTAPAPTTTPVDTKPDTSQPITATTVHCDSNGLSPAYLVAHYSNTFLPVQRLIIATGTPDNSNTPVNQIVIDNFVGSVGASPVGANSMVNVSGDNSLPSKCGLCLAATRGTDNVGPYKVLSGAIELSTPSNQGTVMAVTFHNVVLEMKTGNTTTHWCIDNVTASTNTRSWSCADIGATNQPSCWLSPDGKNAAALYCPNSNQAPQSLNCAAVGGVCGSNVANNNSIKSTCN